MRILVVNPNSSADVTAGIRTALAPLGACFEVVDCPEGPATIRTDQDVATAAELLAARFAAEPADGYVTCCFSDPGLDLARARGIAPVTGAQEAALLEAAALGRFGIIALSARAVARHRARIEAMGLAGQLVDELALGDVSASDSGRDGAVYAQILALGQALRAQGAQVLVLGCAGMAQLVARLGQDLQIPVIDPVAAAGRLALARANAIAPVPPPQSPAH